MRFTQRPAGAQLNRASGIAQGLAFFAPTNEKAGYPRDLVTGLALDKTGHGLSPILPTWSASRGGVSLTGAARGAMGATGPAQYRQATAITAIVTLDDAINLGSTFTLLGSFDNNVNDFFNWSLWADDAVWTLNGFYIRIGGAIAATSHDVRTAGLHTYAFVGYINGSDTKFDVWCDGVFNQTITAVGAVLGGSPSNTNISVGWGSGAGMKAMSMAFWHRNLTSPELKRLRSADALNDALLPQLGRPRRVFSVPTVTPPIVSTTVPIYLYQGL